MFFDVVDVVAQQSKSDQVVQCLPDHSCDRDLACHPQEDDLLWGGIHSDISRRSRLEPLVQFAIQPAAGCQNTRWCEPSRCEGPRWAPSPAAHERGRCQGDAGLDRQGGEGRTGSLTESR